MTVMQVSIKSYFLKTVFSDFAGKGSERNVLLWALRTSICLGKYGFLNFTTFSFFFFFALNFVVWCIRKIILKVDIHANYLCIFIFIIIINLIYMINCISDAYKLTAQSMKSGNSRLWMFTIPKVLFWN